MKVAIVDKSNDLLKKVREELLKKQDKKEWDVGSYRTGEELLSDDTTTIDVVLIDHDTVGDSDEEVLENLSGMNLDVAILNGTKPVSEDPHLLSNERVNAILDKKDPEDVFNFLDYVDAKQRINKHVQRNSDIYSKIVSETNGCVYEVREGITLLGISKLLSKEKIDIITKAIESTNNKVVLYFTKEVRVVSSSFFGLLIVFWERIVKERRGKMAYWLKDADTSVMHMGKMLSISELFPFFFTLSDALEYVKES